MAIPTRNNACQITPSLLDLGDVGLVLQGGGDGSGVQRVRAYVVLS